MKSLLYVSINFTGHLLLEFGRYCSKVLPELAVFHLLWTPALTTNVFSILFSHWPIVNNSRNKRVSAFFYASLVLIQSLYFLHKNELFWIKYRTTNNYKKRGHPFVQQCFVKLCPKLQCKLASRSCTGGRGT